MSSVTLRQPNNQFTDMTILNVLKNVMNMDALGNYNTQIAANSTSGTGVELVYIEAKEKMTLNMTASSPYAVHLSCGAQKSRKQGFRTYMGSFVAILEYCARWDENGAESIDDILQDIASDLERIKSNIESNDSLAYGGIAHTISVPEMDLSPYAGEFDKSFQGLTLVQRTLTLSFNVLPYDC